MDDSYLTGSRTSNDIFIAQKKTNYQFHRKYPSHGERTAVQSKEESNTNRRF